MQLTIYHRDGIAVKTEIRGVMGSMGGHQSSYELTSDGKIFHSSYDHCCGQTKVNQPISIDVVPNGFRAILGNPIEQLAESLSGDFTLMEMR